MFLLVLWCLDVVSLSRVLQSTVSLGADVVSFGAQNVSFGMLVVPNLAPWGARPPISFFLVSCFFDCSDCSVEAREKFLPETTSVA